MIRLLAYFAVLIFCTGLANAAGGTAAPLRDWTIMLYMSGKQGVPTGGWDDLAEITSIGSTGKVAVVAEIGSDRFADRFTGTKRFVFTKGMDVLSATPAMRLENVDQGDWKNLASFVLWAKKTAPAKRYMFVFWAHGMGFIDQKKNGRGVGFDLTTNNYLTLPELRLFAQTAKVDVIAFNACLMGMAEVMYELQGSVKYVVASEETMPGPGYDYKAFLAALNAAPSATEEKAAALLSASYMNYFQAQGEDVQLSIIRPDASVKLAQMLAVWQRNARAVNDTAAFNYANQNTVRLASVISDSNDTSVYGDLGNFLELFGSRLDLSKPGAPQLKEQGDVILKFITSELALSKGSGSYADTKGIAIYLPATSPRVTAAMLDSATMLEVKYSDLGFAKAAKWPEFIQWGYAARAN